MTNYMLSFCIHQTKPVNGKHQVQVKVNASVSYEQRLELERFFEQNSKNKGLDYITYYPL